MESRGMADTCEYEDEIFRLHTRYLISGAHRLILPTPDRKNEELWRECIVLGRKTLSRKGIHELRTAIRAEKKARVERFLMWVPGVVGILGTLIGLASILTGREGRPRKPSTFQV
jgi:hypothetical protein